MFPRKPNKKDEQNGYFKLKKEAKLYDTCVLLIKTITGSLVGEKSQVLVCASLVQYVKVTYTNSANVIDSSYELKNQAWRYDG